MADGTGGPPASGGGGGAPPTGAPATYAAFTFAVDAPKLEGDALTGATTAARELGLSQEAAQKFVTREAANAAALAAAAKKAGGAPAAYEAFKLPDGAKLEGDTLKQFTDFAKDLGLTQEHAQKFVDREIQLQRDMDTGAVELVKKQGEAWETAARQDNEIGGAKYDENLGVANKALEQFGSQSLRDMLKTTPLGKNPEVLRFLVKIGNAIAQDKFVPAERGAPAGDAGLRAMYPSMKTA